MRDPGTSSNAERSPSCLGTSVEGETLFLGTKWPNRHHFHGKDLAGEEKKCYNGTLLCIISLNLTNSAGASGEETRVLDSAGLSPWAGAKQRG